MQCSLKRSKLTVKLSFPAKTLCPIRLKFLGTREQMNFASLTPGQLNKESNTMTLSRYLFIDLTPRTAVFTQSVARPLVSTTCNLQPSTFQLGRYVSPL